MGVMLTSRGGIVDMAVDILELADQHETFFVSQPLEQLERAIRLAGLLSAFGVTPTKRAVQNGHLHQLFAAVLVVIHDGYEGEFSISTRNSTELAKLPLSSSVVSWLAKCVEQELLLFDPRTGVYKLSNTLRQAARPLTALEVVGL